MTYAPVICNPCSLTYGERLGIAGLKRKAITFQVSLQQGFVIGILTPGRFSILTGRVKSKVLSSSLQPGGGAHSRALKADSHNPPFPVGYK